MAAKVGVASEDVENENFDDVERVGGVSS